MNTDLPIRSKDPARSAGPVAYPGQTSVAPQQHLPVVEDPAPSENASSSSSDEAIELSTHERSKSSLSKNQKARLRARARKLKERRKRARKAQGIGIPNRSREALRDANTVTAKDSVNPFGSSQSAHKHHKRGKKTGSRKYALFTKQDHDEAILEVNGQWQKVFNSFLDSQQNAAHIHALNGHFDRLVDDGALLIGRARVREDLKKREVTLRKEFQMGKVSQAMVKHEIKLLTFGQRLVKGTLLRKIGLYTADAQTILWYLPFIQKFVRVASDDAYLLEEQWAKLRERLEFLEPGITGRTQEILLSSRA